MGEFKVYGINLCAGKPYLSSDGGKGGHHSLCNVGQGSETHIES